MKKNLFFTFIFSFIPGAGQMYQEYMKRGLSIMIIFGIFVVLTAMLATPIILVPIMVILAYSFFDTYNIRNMNEEKASLLKDDYIWNSNELIKTFEFKKNNNSRKIVGIALLSIGIYALLDSVLLSILRGFNIEWVNNLIYTFSRYTPTIIVSLLAVYIGSKLISSSKEE
ncbi:MAG: hypothetical protein PHR25_02535 [Clostridia bacterium]|nr:hypothetical protein [Clostridia bacterium]MDD4375636.1 hypothetical protein [Clostridia bacterium]